MKNEDITVVVQGPVESSVDREMDEGITKLCLKSVREHLPGAKIILSTWPDQPIDDLDYDKLVISKDPGPNINYYDAEGNPQNKNNNRQIVSTIEGLRRVNTKYAMKLRTDNYLIGDQFKQLQTSYQQRNIKYAFLKERLVINNTFTRAYAKGYPVAFHACDFFYFGLTEDVKKMWSFPLIDDLKYDPKNSGREQHESYPNKLPDCTQKLFLLALNQFDCNLKIAHLHDFSPKIKAASDLIYANNFVIGEPKTIGLGLCSKFSNRRASNFGNRLSYLSFGEWLILYKKYCDPHIETSQYKRKELLRSCFRFIINLGKKIESTIKKRI